MVKINSQESKLSIIQIIMLIVAGLVNATGVALFLTPATVLDGGISGLSVLLSMLTEVPVSVFIIVINIPFYLFGWRRMGIRFIIYSIIAIVSYSLFSALYQFTGLDDIMYALLGGDRILCLVFGAILSGIGSGMTIRYGGGIDGVEVMAVLFAKRLTITVGQFVMIFNCILYTTSCFLTMNFQIGLYSILAYAIGLKAVDFVVEGLDRAKACIIITDHCDALAGAISGKMMRGVTLIDSKGYYSGQEKTMVYCVVNRFEIGLLKSIVAEIDPSAFVTINDIGEVLGSGVKKRSKRERTQYSKQYNLCRDAITVASVCDNLERTTTEETDSIDTDNNVNNEQTSQDNA
ncbi:MAG: YitT family protein [Clostridia bacterium]|nr:YitT family protein [Clostridia bacterium]